MRYNWTEKDLRPWYKHSLPETGLKVLIYSGDVDAAVKHDLSIGFILCPKMRIKNQNFNSYAICYG